MHPRAVQVRDSSRLIGHEINTLTPTAQEKPLPKWVGVGVKGRHRGREEGQA